MKPSVLIVTAMLSLSFLAFPLESLAGLTQSREISAGDLLYNNSLDEKTFRGQDATRTIAYFYVGSDGSSLKFSVEQSYIVISDVSVDNLPKEAITIPINKNKQALLKVRTLNEQHPNEEILITVIDDFYRLKAEALTRK